MGFLDKLLGREKKEEDMPAEPQMRSEGTQPDTSSMAEPPAAPPPAPPADMPGTEGTAPPPERNEP